MVVGRFRVLHVVAGRFGKSARTSVFVRDFSLDGRAQQVRFFSIEAIISTAQPGGRTRGIFVEELV